MKAATLHSIVISLVLMAAGLAAVVSAEGDEPARFAGERNAATLNLIYMIQSSIPP